MKNRFCPEAALRRSLTDSEFWAHVYGIELESGMDEPDLDDDKIEDQCLVCGSTGACMYDSEGRPLIHSVEDDIDGISDT